MTRCILLLLAALLILVGPLGTRAWSDPTGPSSLTFDVGDDGDQQDPDPQTATGYLYLTGAGWGNVWFILVLPNGELIGSLYVSEAAYPWANPNGLWTVDYEPQPDGSNRVTGMTRAGK